MIVDPQITNWRAIEALRAGVPNKDAVQALGSSQIVIEKRFDQLLESVKEGLPLGIGAEGMLFAGDFGSGKSHLMEYIQHIAVAQNFVCSKVVVSKETPLYDPAKLYQVAIQSAKAKESSGRILKTMSKNLDFESPRYQEFRRWVASDEANLNPYFAASAFIFEQCKGGRYPEISDRILRFWAGSKVPEREMRSWLEELGEEGTYNLDRAPDRDLLWQRYQFTPNLLSAAGYAGWIILVDEVELIGRYSPAQRARSYGVMTQLLGNSGEWQMPGLGTVFALTTAYESEVMDDRQDDKRIPAKLRVSGDEEEAALAEQAMQKIRQIPLENMVLNETVDLSEVYGRCRAVYARAYDWDPPSGFETNGTWRIRQHIKRWISTWDLLRLFQDSQPDILVSSLQQNYFEDADLEISGKEEEEAEEHREFLLDLDLKSHIFAKAPADHQSAWTDLTLQICLSGGPIIDSNSPRLSIRYTTDESDGSSGIELGSDDFTVTRVASFVDRDDPVDRGQTYEIRVQGLHILPRTSFQLSIGHPKTQSLVIRRKLPPRFTQQAINLN